MAVSSGGDLVRLALPGGTVAGGPWQLGAAVHAVAAAEHLYSTVLVTIQGAGYLVKIDPQTGQPGDLGGYTRVRRSVVCLSLPGEASVAVEGYDGGEIWSLQPRAKGPLVSFPADYRISVLAAARVGKRTLLAVGTERGQVTAWWVEWPGLADAPRLERLAEHRIVDDPPDQRPESADDVGGRNPHHVSALAIACDVADDPVLVAAAGRTIHAWTMSGTPVFGPVRTEHRFPVLALLAEADNDSPVLWSSDGVSLVRSDLRSGAPIATPFVGPAQDDESMQHCVLARSGDQIVVATGYGTGLVRTFTAPVDPPLLTAGGPGAVAPGNWDNTRHYPTRVAVSTLGRPVVLAAFSDRVIRGYDLATGADMVLPPTLATMVATGDQTLLGHVSDGQIRWYDPADGAPVGQPAVLEDGDADAVCVATVAGRPILVVNSGLDLHRFDVLTGRHLGAAMAGHRDRIYGIAVGHSQGVPIAASCSQDGTVRLWDLRSGDPIGAPLTGHGGGANAVAALALPEHRLLLFSAGQNGQVFQHDLTSLPRRHQPAPRTVVLRASGPVQSLAAVRTTGDSTYTLLAASHSTILHTQHGSTEVSTHELPDTITDVAATHRTAVVATGAGLYALDLRPSQR